MIDLSKYKGIVFDMDGTLIDSMGAHIQAWEQTCKHYGYAFDYAYMHGLGGVPTAQIARILNDKFGLNHDPIEVAATKRHNWAQLEDIPCVIPDTLAVAEHYQGQLKMGIGTGSDRRHAEHAIEQTGLDKLISVLVTASDVSLGKPHPETFLKVAEGLGLAPEECVVFEDTPIGLQAAKAANMDCILVQNGKVQLPVVAC